MNIFYEESGHFKAACIVQKNDSTYQADTQHGKRVKIKAANVFLEFDGDMDAFMQNAQDEAAAIDTGLLWECVGTDEFTFREAAQEYFGSEPKAVAITDTKPSANTPPRRRLVYSSPSIGWSDTIAVAVKSPTASNTLNRKIAPATINACQSKAKPYLNGTGSVTSGRFCSAEKSTLPKNSATM